MIGLWNSHDAVRYSSDLALRVYSSQLLGRDPSLVLHGGGNTSVKLREVNVLGEAVDILYVKGSGWDLQTILEPGFAPVRLAHLLKLATLESLCDSTFPAIPREPLSDSAIPVNFTSSPSGKTIV